ncbi:hypothetical protein CPC197_1811B, partial [Chlamydia psittaci C1/97]
KLQLSPQEADH